MKDIFKNNEELLNKVVESADILKDDKKKELKLSAIKHLMEIKRPYDEDIYDDKLLINLYLKKIDFILEANTKKDIEEILSVSHIRYNGGEIIPTKYNILEEELLMWSITSVKSPLMDIAHKRYMELFKVYYGEDIYKKVAK